MTIGSHPPGLDVRLLGPLSVAVDGREVAIGSPKQRVILAMLALSGRVRVDSLVEELWWGRPPASVATTLQALVSRLRRTLDHAGAGAAIRFDGTAYVLDLDPQRIDVRRFEELAVAGRRARVAGSPADAAHCFRQGLALWRDGALADLVDRDFARVTATRLEEARLEVVEELADAELAAGRPAAALEVVDGMISGHPFRERLRSHQMVALYRLGRQAEALSAYQDLRRVLADELGLEPTPSLQALERQILLQSPRLDPPGGPASPVPSAATSFVGRERELDELAALLRNTRLLTISGLGGSGKTRLAAELARRVEKSYADGVRFVDLTGVHDAIDAVPEMLSVLGVHPGAPPGEQHERLCHALAARHVLLVLDNCEHLIEPVSAAVGVVLPRCGKVTVLVTSREVLSVAGEAVWPAPGLSLPTDGAATADRLEGSDAVRLFAERARVARPGFAVTDANAAAVARICRRLDGLPLALELAAARISVLGATQLAEHLEDRLRLLHRSAGTGPLRQGTMRAALDWSYELLAPAEQRLLARLSVFPHDFDLDAATALAGDTADAVDVLDALARLVDRSLLVTDGWSDRCRYRLLETVRQYGAERLAGEGLERETAARHRRHYVARVQAAQRAGAGFNTTAWAISTAADRGNFHAALVGALTEGDLEAASILIAGIWTTWFWFGPIPAIPASMADIDPEIVDRFDPDFRVQALLGLASAGWITGRFSADALQRIYDQTLRIAEASGDRRDQGFACYFLGYLARGRGDLTAARSWTDEALLRWRHDGYAHDRAWAHYELGWIDVAEDHLRSARRHFEAGLDLLAAAGDDLLEIHLRAGLGFTEAAGGDGPAGVALARQAVDAARGLAFPSVLVMALVRAAETATVAGSPAGAELAEALRLLREQGTSWWVSTAVRAAALAHEAEGNPQVAARLLGGAAGLSDASEDSVEALPVVTALVEAARRRIADALGDDEVARQDAAGRRLSPVQLLDVALGPAA